MTKTSDGDVVFSAKDIRITKGLAAVVIALGPLLGVGAARVTAGSGNDEIQTRLVRIEQQIAVVGATVTSVEKRLDRIEDRN